MQTPSRHPDTSEAHIHENVVRPLPSAADRRARAIGAVAAVAVGIWITAFALWYASAGNFPDMPGIQNDYLDLGKSFLRGKLWLLEKPDPRLAELGNPYEYTQRKGIPYHWDASYYEGRYYLYWGPAPAMVSAGLQYATGRTPSASVLSLIPYLGLLGVAAVLLFRLARPFGPAAHLTAGLFLLPGLFSFPMLYTLGQPRHYQASILYGQFFLLAGVLAISLYAGRRRWIWLIIAGLAWGFSFASRYNLAVSIATYLLVMSIWIWRDRKESSFWSRILFLGVPLALCVAGLGLYNLARFGNPLETGMSYQLTIPEFHQINYSVKYVRSGLYIYLLYPLTASTSFPFIQSAHFNPGLLPAVLRGVPGREFDQVVIGLLHTAPALWAIVIVLIGSLAVLLTGRAVRQVPVVATSGLELSMLGLGALGQFIFLLLFFYVAQRYVIDFYLPLVMCTAVAVWWMDANVGRHRALRSILWVLVVGLVLWTAAIAYFACFGVPVLVANYYDARMLSDLGTFWNALAGNLRGVLAARP